MKKYIYTGKIRNNAKKSDLIYISNGIANVNGLVEIKHIATQDLFYYSKSQFLKIFKSVL